MDSILLPAHIPSLAAYRIMEIGIVGGTMLAILAFL
jgi:hypothetical protein